MSNQLPDVNHVNLDYNATIDIHLEARETQISKDAAWLERLLASRVACNPWDCLARAFSGPSVNTSLPRDVISLLPSYGLVEACGLPDELLDLATFGLDLTTIDVNIAFSRLS